MNNTLPRILCVDDEPNVIEGLRRTLRRSCDVSVALGAAAAIEAIESQGPFAAVVSDLQMPGMDGIELLRWVFEQAPDTSGILLTGNANLSAAIAAVNAGFIFRFLVKPCPAPDLLSAVAAGCNRHDAKCAERVLLSQAVDQDAVTGLPDRRRFAADVMRLRELEPGLAVALIVIGIDDLELLRRTLGHTAADGAMVASAQRLMAAVREPRHQLNHAALFRVDDRLAVLWCERAASSAEQIASHLLKAMETDLALAGQSVRLAGHAGIAILQRDAIDPLILLRNAEDACLAASVSRDARIAHFSASVHAREQRRMRILQELRNPQFVSNLSCAFQPQWELRANRLIGLEALVRWQNDVLGAVSPAEFIPIAEEHPEISNRLADWMLRSACRQRLAWRSLLSDEVRVAVNLSATQLQTGEVHERVRRVLTDTGLPAALLEVEITESAAIADFARSTVELLDLRRQGVGVAIDDFGVGYSSLSYLAELPVTSLKIDRAFIHDIVDDSRRMDLLRGICRLGHAMHMSVVVEGIESLQVAAVLRKMECDVIQGFAVSQPLPADAFIPWFENEGPVVAAAIMSQVHWLQRGAKS